MSNPETTIRKLVKALEECANDLEAELKARYPESIRKYPSEQRHFDNDMVSVDRARDVIAEVMEGGR